MRKPLIKVLMDRDGLDEFEAQDQIDEVKMLLQEAIDMGCGLTTLEEIVSDELGLEPDFLDELGVW